MTHAYVFNGDRIVLSTGFGPIDLREGDGAGDAIFYAWPQEQTRVVFHELWKTERHNERLEAEVAKLRERKP